MSDNKKYYYLKLKDNFFDSDEMIVLESMPDGYKYSNILLKLYLRSLKNEGKLMFNDRIPYNSNILAQVTRHSIGDVEKAIQVLSDLNLIEILDNGAIYITDIQNFIGTSSTEADRKREYRNRIEGEKQELLPNGQMSQLNRTNVPKNMDKCPDKSPPEIEIEIEKDIELDKETKTEQKNSSSSSSSQSSLRNLFLFYEKNIGQASSYIQEELHHWANDLNADVVLEAIKISVEMNKKSYNYINGILKNWVSRNVETVEDINALKVEHENQKNSQQSKYRKGSTYQEPTPQSMQGEKEPTKELTPEEQAAFDQELEERLRLLGIE